MLERRKRIHIATIGHIAAAQIVETPAPQALQANIYIGWKMR